MSHLQANIYLIDDFARGLSSNCYVKLSVSGWANQVYLYGNISYQNGQFAGNFDNRSQVEYLRQTLINYVMNGTCNLAGY
ncbi:MAG: hypothetical protein JST80_07495 [Bdellovibrionales bacterium]|nr:hypothetical protein [Bdellovibrionales bacterium]